MYRNSNPCALLLGLKNGITTMETSISDPYDQVIQILNTYPKYLKAVSSGDICKLMFLAALFTIVKRGKQPKCWSSGGWMEYEIYRKCNMIHPFKGRKS